MTALRYLLWFLFAAISYGLLETYRYIVRKKGGYRYRVWIAFVKLVLATGIAGLLMASNTWIAWGGSLFFAALYVALMGTAAADVIEVCCALLSKAWSKGSSAGKVSEENRESEENEASKRSKGSKGNEVRGEKQKAALLPKWWQLALSAGCVTAFLIYGTMNMQVVRSVPVYFESEKLENNYSIAFLSDLHAGSSQSMETSRSIIRRIGEEDVDLLILGGDITDEYTTREEMEEIISLIGKIDVPTYFFYGNHDRQPNADKVGGRTYTDEELEKALLSNGIVPMEDEWLEFSEDLVIMGRDDVSTGVDRLPIEEIPERPKDKSVLLVDHSPYIIKDTEESRADLQLSGHTHAGQLFPLQALYNLSGYDAYGFYLHGDTDTFVGAGAAGWSFPLRTEAHSEYYIINLMPAAEERDKMSNPD